MTQSAIQHQIEVIRQATAEACQSKETARQFLIDAGIIKEKGEFKAPEKKNG